MTNETQTAEHGQSSTIEKVAAVTSAAIVLTGVVFWIIQIRGVMEMLELAYG